MTLPRGSQDLAKDRAPHYKKARRFFDGVAAQLVQQQHSLDVFACALDQASQSPYCSALASIGAYVKVRASQKMRLSCCLACCTAVCSPWCCLHLLNALAGWPLTSSEQNLPCVVSQRLPCWQMGHLSAAQKHLCEVHCTWQFLWLFPHLRVALQACLEPPLLPVADLWRRRA